MYVLDEPIGGVDQQRVIIFLRTIIQNRRPNSSVLSSTHLIADIEQVFDEAILTNQGRTSYENTTVSNQHENQSMRSFRDQFVY